MEPHAPFRRTALRSDSLRQVAVHQDLLGSDLVQSATLFLLHSPHGSLSTQSKQGKGGEAGILGRSSGEAGKKGLSSSGRGLPNPKWKRLPRCYLRRGPPPTAARPAAPDTRLTFHRENLAGNIVSGFAPLLPVIGSLRGRSHSGANERLRKTCAADVINGSREKDGRGSPAPNSGFCLRCSCCGDSRPCFPSWRRPGVSPVGSDESRLG